MKLTSQEKLRKRILYIGFLMVIAVITILYFFSAYYDHINLNKKILTTQSIIKTQFKDIFLNLEKSTERFQHDSRLHHFFTMQDDTYPLYQELSLLNASNLKYHLVLFNEQKEVIFSSFTNSFDSIDKNYQMIF